MGGTPGDGGELAVMWFLGCGTYGHDGWKFTPTKRKLLNSSSKKNWSKNNSNKKQSSKVSLKMRKKCWKLRRILGFFPTLKAKSFPVRHAMFLESNAVTSNEKWWRSCNEFQTQSRMLFFSALQIPAHSSNLWDQVSAKMSFELKTFFPPLKSWEQTPAAHFNSWFIHVHNKQENQIYM